MGLDRTFLISATTLDREGIYDVDLAQRAADAIAHTYRGWYGSLYNDNNLMIDGVNWYDVDSDMERISRQFPELVFNVECIGMGLDDTWYICYCNGRSSGGCAEYPDPDYDYLLSGQHSEKKSVLLGQNDLIMIREALNTLMESRQEEMRWAGDDHDIIEANTQCVGAIDDLLERLK